MVARNAEVKYFIAEPAKKFWAQTVFWATNSSTTLGDALSAHVWAKFDS